MSDWIPATSQGTPGHSIRNKNLLHRSCSARSLHLRLNPAKSDEVLVASCMSQQCANFHHSKIVSMLSHQLMVREERGKKDVMNHIWLKFLHYYHRRGKEPQGRLFIPTQPSHCSSPFPVPVRAALRAFLPYSHPQLDYSHNPCLGFLSSQHAWSSCGKRTMPTSQ
jgi:hypothetical protein